MFVAMNDLLSSETLKPVLANVLVTRTTVVRELIQHLGTYLNLPLSVHLLLFVLHVLVSYARHLQKLPLSRTYELTALFYDHLSFRKIKHIVSNGC